MSKLQICYEITVGCEHGRKCSLTCISILVSGHKQLLLCIVRCCLVIFKLDMRYISLHSVRHLSYVAASSCILYVQHAKNVLLLERDKAENEGGDSVNYQPRKGGGDVGFNIPVRETSTQNGKAKTVAGTGPTFQPSGFL